MKFIKKSYSTCEDPKNVFNVGSLGAENISKLTYLNKRYLKKRLIIFKRFC